jgi:hypothetical protein
MGGRTVPGSGAGHQKGDVVAPGIRVEVKNTTGSRWRVPLWQLRQLGREADRRGETPAVVFSATEGPSLALAPMEIVEGIGLTATKISKLDGRRKHLTISVASAEKMAGNMVLFDIKGRSWTLCTYGSFTAGVSLHQKKADACQLAGGLIKVRR